MTAKLSIAMTELLRCISERGKAKTQGERWGNAIGEADWAVEVLIDKGVLPDEFYQPSI